MPTRDIHKTLVKLNIIVILIGGLFLVWYYGIDGKIINRPLIFIRDVDPENFKLDKRVYKVGETPRLLTAFCKNRSAIGVVEWTLIDGQKVTYGPSEPREIPIGCYPENGGLVFADIERIPIYILDTCEAYFVGVGHLTISGGRTVDYKYKTEKFCIEGSEELKTLIE